MRLYTQLLLLYPLLFPLVILSYKIPGDAAKNILKKMYTIIALKLSQKIITDSYTSNIASAINQLRSTTQRIK